MAEITAAVVNEVDDATAGLEAHLFAIGQTVVELMSNGRSATEAIEEMAKRSSEPYELVRQATISVLNEALAERS